MSAAFEGPLSITSTTVSVSLYIIKRIPIPPKWPTNDSLSLIL